MSLVLGIDTSGDVRVGVARDGVVVARRQVADTRQHVEQVVALVRDAVAAAGALDELALVCVGLGPGPFTGLRVGIAAAQVLSAVRRVPLHGVCSLDVLARAYAQGADPTLSERAQLDPTLSERAQRVEEFIAASDARRKEVYWARYDAAGVRLGEPQVSPPEKLPDLTVVGPGATVFPDVLAARAVDGPRCVDAGLMAALGESLPSAGTEPLYLRRPDATEPTRRKSTLVRPPVRVRGGRR